MVVTTVAFAAMAALSVDVITRAADGAAQSTHRPDLLSDAVLDDMRALLRQIDELLTRWANAAPVERRGKMRGADTFSRWNAVARPARPPPTTATRDGGALAPTTAD